MACVVICDKVNGVVFVIGEWWEFVVSGVRSFSLEMQICTRRNDVMCCRSFYSLGIDYFSNVSIRFTKVT